MLFQPHAMRDDRRIGALVESLRTYRFGIAAAIAVAAISAACLIRNGSPYFELEFVSRVGDQRLYYDLTLGLLRRSFEKSPYTIGYSVFMAPFAIATGVSPDWRSIMPGLIAVQSLILVPLSFFAIYRAVSCAKAFAALSLLFAVYYCSLLLRSSDVLIKWDFLGLVALSEPIAIALLLAFHALLLKDELKLSQALVAGAVMGAALMCRSTLIILLIAPVIMLVLARRWALVVSLGMSCCAIYSVQLYVNYRMGGSVRFNGYAWWNELNASFNRDTIRAIYGVDATALFSIDYLRRNVTALLPNYALLLYFCFRVFLSDNVRGLLVAGSLMAFLILHLAYWWSGTYDMIDRFMMPAFFLSLFYIARSMSVRHAPQSAARPA
jgi:hypothetical protein